jgi:LysR family transcriptional regulator, benzoate and cis,cis-muconate-responsive activator of ben and cat genes
MELRHLRYFLAVGETMSFSKAAVRLRVAQSALSRQVQDLEGEIGVELVRRSPRGVTLTAEGRLFLQEVRQLLKRTDELVEKVRALVRGEYSELHVGYRVPTMEILPPALAAFQKAVPGGNVLLHELSFDELIAGLRNATLELAIMFQPTGEQIAGIEFESLRTYPYYMALTAAHPFARLKSIPLEKLAAEPLLGLRRKDYRQYLDRIFAPIGVKPRFAVECDTFSSILIQVEAGQGVALCIPTFNHTTGKNLLYRPLTGTTEALSVGIARARKGDVTPVGEKFCERLWTERPRPKQTVDERSGGRGDAQGQVNARYGTHPSVTFYTQISDQYAPYYTVLNAKENGFKVSKPRTSSALRPNAVTKRRV